MHEIGKELIRWLLGGGAVALATFLGTTAYQQGQLQIERERNLRDFLGRYVELATKGSLDERIRFVQYWESLDVADRIGVDLTSYKQALAAEFKQAEIYAAVVAGDGGQGGPPREPTAPEGAPGASPPVAAADPPRESGSPPDERAPPASTPPASSSEPSPETGPPAEQRPPPVQQAAPAQQIASEQRAYFTSRSQTIAKILPGAEDAPSLERRGFEALLANDIPAAREAFAAAEKAWPEYHNVAEIHDLLSRLSETLPRGSNSLPADVHRETLRLILQDYSWGMPPAILARIEQTVRR